MEHPDPGRLGDAMTATQRELLLFRRVPGHRRAQALRLLDAHGAAPWASELTELWELHDPSVDDEEVTAVAATACPAGGRHVEVLAVVVATERRRRGTGTRLLEELADALRARGAAALVAAVPGDASGACAFVQHAGFCPSGSDPGSRLVDGADLLWFDLEL